MSESLDGLGAGELRLICQLLHIDDLRNARQVSKTWRDAASSTVAAIAVTAESSQLLKAASAFDGSRKLHLVVAHDSLSLPNDAGAGSDQLQPAAAELGSSQAEGTPQDTSSAEVGSVRPMLTLGLAALQNCRPRTLMCVDMADDLYLSTPEQRSALFQQLCRQLLQLEPHGTVRPAVVDAAFLSGTESPVAARSSTSDGSRGVDCRSDVATADASSSSPVPAAACARSPQSIHAFRTSAKICSSRPSTHVAARPGWELLLKIPWLPRPHTCPAAWSLLSQLTSLQTLLLDQTLTGKPVAALVNAAPQLTQLSITVTGGDSRLEQLSQLQKLNSLFISAVSTDHSVVSRGVIGLSQLQHLHISGDLVLQPPSTASVDYWLPVHWPQLQTLVLQQPLKPAQLAALVQQQQHHDDEPSPSSGNSNDSNRIAPEAYRLQQLLVWVEDSSEATGQWFDSSIRTLQVFQQAIHQVQEAGPGAQLMINDETIATGSLAVAMSQVLKHPSGVDADTLLHLALRRGSGRPSSIPADSLSCFLRRTGAKSSTSWQLGSPEPNHVGLQQLLVRCGASCDLSAVLQRCQPRELTVATVPAGVDMLQQAGVAIYSQMISVGRTPIPWFLELGFKADTGSKFSCLRTIVIDTSFTRAGLIVVDEVLQAISSSCPSLVCLQLKGLLAISLEGLLPLGQGCKGLKALALIDTRVQTLEYLVDAMAAVVGTAEPEQQRQQRQRRLTAARCGLAGVGMLSGFVIGVWRPRRFLDNLLWSAATAAASYHFARELNAGLLWNNQVVVMNHLVRTAKILNRTPKIAACWLPPQLRSLHIEGCELKSHHECSGCELTIEKLQLLQRCMADGIVVGDKGLVAADKGVCGRDIPRWGFVLRTPALAQILGKSLVACMQPLARGRWQKCYG